MEQSIGFLFNKNINRKIETNNDEEILRLSYKVDCLIELIYNNSYNIKLKENKIGNSIYAIFSKLKKLKTESCREHLERISFLNINNIKESLNTDEIDDLNSIFNKITIDGIYFLDFLLLIPDVLKSIDNNIYSPFKMLSNLYNQRINDSYIKVNFDI